MLQIPRPIWAGLVSLTILSGMYAFMQRAPVTTAPPPTAAVAAAPCQVVLQCTGPIAPDPFQSADGEAAPSVELWLAGQRVAHLTGNYEAGHEIQIDMNPEVTAGAQELVARVALADSAWEQPHVLRARLLRAGQPPQEAWEWSDAGSGTLQVNLPWSGEPRHP